MSSSGYRYSEQPHLLLSSHLKWKLYWISRSIQIWNRDRCYLQQLEDFLQLQWCCSSFLGFQKKQACALISDLSITLHLIMTPFTNLSPYWVMVVRSSLSQTLLYEKCEITKSMYVNIRIQYLILIDSKAMWYLFLPSFFSIYLLSFTITNYATPAQSHSPTYL